MTSFMYQNMCIAEYLEYFNKEILKFPVIY